MKNVVIAALMMAAPLASFAGSREIGKPVEVRIVVDIKDVTVKCSTMVGTIEVRSTGTGTILKAANADCGVQLEKGVAALAKLMH